MKSYSKTRTVQASLPCKERLIPKILMVQASLLLLALSVGSTFIAPWAWANNENWPILVYLRLPRVLAALLCGSALAMAGCASQALFRNPLASADILGIASGGSLAVLLVMAFHPPYIVVLLASFTGCLVVSLVLLRVSKKGIQTLILVALALGALMNGLISLILLLKNDGQIATFYHWLMGSLENRQYGHLLFGLPFVALAGFFLYRQSPSFNLLSYGLESAESLGLNIKKFQYKILFLSALLVAVSVSVAGPIGFVGLMAPHFAQFFVGNNFKKRLVASSFVGAILLLVGDTLGRTLFQPLEVKAGIVMAILGSAYFIFLILHRDR